MGSAVSDIVSGLGTLGNDLGKGNFGGFLGDLGGDIMGAPGWLMNQVGGGFGFGAQPGGDQKGLSAPTDIASGKAFDAAPKDVKSGPMVSSPKAAASLASGDPTNPSSTLLGGPSGAAAPAPGSTPPLGSAPAALAGPPRSVLPADMTAAAAAPAPTGDAAKPGGDAGGGILSRLLGGLNGVPGGPMSLLIPAAETLFGQHGAPGAAGLRSYGNNLMNESTVMNRAAASEMQGILPGPAQAAVDQGLQSARTAIISNYAAMGIPETSSMVQGALAAANQAAQAAAFQEAQQMAQTGFSAAFNEGQLGAQVFEAAMQATMQHDASFMNNYTGYLHALYGGQTPPAPTTPTPGP